MLRCQVLSGSSWSYKIWCLQNILLFMVIVSKQDQWRLLCKNESISFFRARLLNLHRLLVQSSWKYDIADIIFSIIEGSCWPNQTHCLILSSSDLQVISSVSTGTRLLTSSLLSVPNTIITTFVVVYRRLHSTVLSHFIMRYNWLIFFCGHACFHQKIFSLCLKYADWYRTC